MKQVILNIPDSNYEFFIELMKKLNFTIADSSEEEIPKEVQEMVLERLRTSKREDMLTWEEAKAKLKFK
jgi:hypothetical protein